MGTFSHGSLTLHRNEITSDALLSTFIHLWSVQKKTKAPNLRQILLYTSVTVVCTTAKRSSVAHRWCCAIITGKQAQLRLSVQLSDRYSVLFFVVCLFVFLKQLNTHIYSAVTLAAAGCSLIERSVVKSQASAALRSVLGPDAKLLSKNVQLLSIVLLMRACLNGREKHRKSLFSSLAAAS